MLSCKGKLRREPLLSHLKPTLLQHPCNFTVTFSFELNPFAETVRAITFVRRFLDRPEQVKAYFDSESNFLDLVAGTARFFRSVESATTASNGTKVLKSKVDAWKSDCAHTIRQFQDIAFGVSSSNVATSTLSFVPVVGVLFAVSGAIVGLATMPEIEARTTRMNEQLTKGSELSSVFHDVPGLPEYISLTNAMTAFPDESAYKSLCHGILAIVLVAAKHDGDISREFVQELINTSDAALRDLQQPGGMISTTNYADVQLSLTQGVATAGTAGALRLLGMMGPRGFSAATNVAIKMGAVTTAHQVAGQFGNNILRTTRVLRGLGKVCGGVALGFAISEVVNACQVRDQAWEYYSKICVELDKIAGDLTANVEELMKSE